MNTDGLVNWLVSGTVLTTYTDQKVIVNGTLRIATLQLTVTQDHLTGLHVPVQCSVLFYKKIIFMSVWSNNATLTAYGEHAF